MATSKKPEQQLNLPIIKYGEGEPSNELDGEHYIDTVSSIQYNKSNGKWIPVPQFRQRLFLA